MSYKHILVAVDALEESKVLIDKAVMIAKAANAQLSIISADEVYRVDHNNVVGLSPVRVEKNKAETNALFAKLDALKAAADYPIKDTLVGSNSITEEIIQAIKDDGVDLVVCCHHHNFWHSLFSSASELMRTVDVDLFVVSVK